MQTTSQKTHRVMKSAVATFEAMKSLPASAVVLDASGTIVAVNNTWKEFARRNGLRVPRWAIGSNYLQYCRSDEPRLRRFVRELRALLAGQVDLLTFIYPCHSTTEERWFSLIGMPLSLDRPTGVALLHVNLTDMLPLPVSTQRTEIVGKRRGHVRPAINLDAISGAIERSVSETLFSQLNAMFTGGSARDQGVARGDTETMFVRNKLSKRQMQVLRLLGEGKSNKQMAKALFLSPNTIKLHVSAILQRLKLASRTHAALLSSRLHKQGLGAGGDLNSWKKVRIAAQRRRTGRTIRARVSNQPIH